MIAGAFQSQLARRASASGIDLPPALCELLEEYFRLLAHWNVTINLTALPLDPITDEAIDRLLIEPLAATRYLSSDAPSWFDLGSGGGSPAIPFKLAKPAAELTMVESKFRKAAFLREVSRSLRLTGTRVDTERIADVAANSINAGTADLVTVRAVRIDSTLLEAIATLLRPNGRVLLFGARRVDLPILRELEVSRDIPAEPVLRDLIILDRTAP